jgi:hypothetical protein
MTRMCVTTSLPQVIDQQNPPPWTASVPASMASESSGPRSCNDTFFIRGVAIAGIVDVPEYGVRAPR